MWPGRAAASEMVESEKLSTHGRQAHPHPHSHHHHHGHQPIESRRWQSYAPTKLSTEYDSEGGVFVNKLSTSIFDGLAKLKASFERGPDGASFPLVGIVTKYLSVLYDHEDMNALATLSANLGRNLHAKYLVDVKAQQGEVKLHAHGFNHKFRADISQDVPFSGRLPKVMLGVPFGEVRMEEELREDDETGDELREVALSGRVGGRVLGGLVLADYMHESINLKYAYKDREMTLMPCIRWPQQSLSVVFKRQFDLNNKLSYRYNFATGGWDGVFKHRVLENFKLKLGYDSDVRLCWGSFWVGKEDSGAKQAPRKCKLQVMVQVPQDEPQSAIVLFRVKKRWDV